MLTCKETIEMASNSLDRKLSLIERIKLKLHLLICKHCKNYTNQLNFIHKFNDSADKHIEGLDNKLSSSAKSRLQASINKHR